jgi:hypothetical protein
VRPRCTRRCGEKAAHVAVTVALAPGRLGSEAHRTVGRDEDRGELVAAQSNLRGGGARTRWRRRGSGCWLVMEGGAAGRGDGGAAVSTGRGSGGDGGGGRKLGRWPASWPKDVARLLLPVGPDSRPFSPQLFAYEAFSSIKPKTP